MSIKCQVFFCAEEQIFPVFPNMLKMEGQKWPEKR